MYVLPLRAAQYTVVAHVFHTSFAVGSRVNYKR